MKKKRTYPIGAEYSKTQTSFRIWAPEQKKVTLVLEEEKTKIPLKKEAGGYFSVQLPKCKPNTLYQFQLGNDSQLLPDPASRYQPQGVFGPSSVVDSKYIWKEKNWLGIDFQENHIIYELHIGTFTEDGTLKAAAKKLSYLAKLGITLIELMPINEFPGRFGWGYDGVYLFAPYHVYGAPIDVKAFINKAHQLGIGVILDVVYNHFGPEANYFSKFSKKYFNPKKNTDWGEAINFDHPSSREYFITNAKYWIEEFHFDGLRIDATPWLFSEISPHILQELSQTVHKAKPKSRKKIIIGESETQDVRLLHSVKKGGYQYDALWNDDFHHTASVRLKGKREAYYLDYLGTPQEFLSALKYGFLYQGQYHSWQKKQRGTLDLHLPASSFVTFLENHDQIANTNNGKRLYQLSDWGNFKALSSLMLLGPNVPMLFQGQEFGSTAPFHYFADHSENLNSKIYEGRKKFLSQFAGFSTKQMRKNIKKPSDLATFKECILDFSEIAKNKEHVAFYRDLIGLRKKDPVFRSLKNVKLDGAVLNSDAFLVRYEGGKMGERLLVVNFGLKFTFNPAPEPLVSAGEHAHWDILWSSECFEYGGEGTANLNSSFLVIPGHSAIVLKKIIS